MCRRCLALQMFLSVSYYCRKNLAFTTPFKDDIRKLADLKQQIITKDDITSQCWLIPEILYHHTYREQVAQLSQRDRAAGWVSYGQKWKTVNGRQHFTDNNRSVFNHYDVIGQQSNRIRWENAKKAITPLKVIQGHRGRYQSKVRMRLPISD